MNCEIRPFLTVLRCTVCQQLTLLFVMFCNFSCYVQCFLAVCSVIQASGWGLVIALCISVGNVSHKVSWCRNHKKMQIMCPLHAIRKLSWKGLLEVIHASLENAKEGNSLSLCATCFSA